MLLVAAPLAVIALGFMQSRESINRYNPNQNFKSPPPKQPETDRKFLKTLHS